MQNREFTIASKPSKYLNHRKMYSSILTLLLLFSIIHAQTMPDSSLTNDNTDEQLLFRVKWSLLQSMVPGLDEGSVHAPRLPDDIRQLLEEAREYARQNQYDLAIGYLDVVLNYLPEIFLKPEGKTTKPPKTDFTTQLFCGSDLWQQKFSVSVSDQDSTIFEDQNNPFIGVRLAVDAHRGLLKNTRMSLEAKYSREYLYGYHQLSHRSRPSERWSASLENRLEGTRYIHEKQLRYWHNRTRVIMIYSLNHKMTISLEDELQVRDYAYNTSLFSSYWQNQATMNLSADFISKTDFRYDFRLRRYPQQSAQNYYEQLITLNLWPNYLKKNQFDSYSQVRWREYEMGMVDSLLTDPFIEFYHETNARLAIYHALNLQLGASVNWRRYRIYAEALPNYRDLYADAALEYLLASFGRVKLGYRYRNKYHYFSQPQAQATAGIEDFNAHAPTIELDIFHGRFFLNISNVYEIRRYPASPDGALSLYADRDVNTLFLLLSWSFSSRWEINLMANIDNDMARNPYSSDSRSNIVNFELLFKL